MSPRVNTLANITGRVWVAGLGAALIPVYIKLMGVESYALVGIFATLQTVFGLLDLGLSAGLNRELARLSATNASVEERRDLLATFDVLGVIMGVVVAASVYALAPYIAYHWVKAQNLDRLAIQDSIRLIGPTLGLFVLTGFYRGGINGLERQVLLNGIWIATNTIRGVGAVLILMFVAPTVRAFFAWQLCVAALSAGACSFALHKLVNEGAGRGHARPALLKRLWRYSAGWLGNSVATEILGLTDKVVLSRILSLRDFGYYTFACYGAQLLFTLVIAVSAAFFPRFNRFIARNDEAGLANEYRRGYELMTVLLVPAAVTLALFSREAIYAWTRDANLTAAVWQVTAILAVGMGIFGLASVANTAALCEGMFRVSVKATVGIAIIWVPAIVMVARSSGMIGAACMWALMFSSRIIIVPLLHERHLRGEGGIWIRTTLAAVAAAGMVGLTLRLLAPPLTNVWWSLCYLMITWVLMVGAVSAVEPSLRGTIAASMQRLAVRVGR